MPCLNCYNYSYSDAPVTFWHGESVCECVYSGLLCAHACVHTWLLCVLCMSVRLCDKMAETFDSRAAVATAEWSLCCFWGYLPFEGTELVLNRLGSYYYPALCRCSCWTNESQWDLLEGFLLLLIKFGWMSLISWSHLCEQLEESEWLTSHQRWSLINPLLGRLTFCKPGSV